MTIIQTHTDPNLVNHLGKVIAKQKRSAITMKNTATVILGGGQGSRLFPLTLSRCKPALCYGGRYRLIDIPLSNAIHSGSQKIFVITQFLSSSLHKHILSTYQFGNSSPSIELLSTEEKPENKSWFQGTADAVRQNLHYIEETHADYFLILSGDQLYHMDFNHFLECAVETDADMVISCLPINAHDASRMGIMQVDHNHFITGFKEKPKLANDLKDFSLSVDQKQHFEIDCASDLDYLGSMGIYLFKRQTLIDLLSEDPREDFGKHLIPTLVEKGNVAAYVYQGYWEDIGTIESFYAANMALTLQSPPFNCYNESWPIFAKPTALPGAKIFGADIQHSLLCDGITIEDAKISHSIIGPRTSIKNGTTINQTYIMGNDFFKTRHSNVRIPEHLQIGKNTTISKAIIDRHVHIGNNVQLINKDKLSHYDGQNIYIRDGIIIVPHGVSIPDNFIL